MRIALAGNPNSGKTTMYNALTGKSEKVGNWAGVTVDKKEHPVKKTYCRANENIIAVDLPGAYSMSPFTNEESVTSEYIRNEKPDVIINIVDATNLSRSLFFTTQLMELGVPMVVALNKSDINEKRETVIDCKMLSELLGCEVFETVSTNANGLKAVVKAAISNVGKPQSSPYTDNDVDLTDKKSVLESDKRRFDFVNGIVSRVEKRKVFTKDFSYGDKIDELLTNRWLGIPIFALVMFLVFQISQGWAGPYIADHLSGLIDKFKDFVGASLEGGNVFLVSLLTEGIIGGVSAVVGFLPLVMVMYFLIALLEDCGYMARVSVVLDPIFKKVGLSGKSVIPFVIGTGCAVPGVMASRTIRNERERRATVMLAPLMPCGAKLPVIALFAGAFFPEASWVGTLMYFLGILIILFGAVLINRITGNSRKISYFIMELPDYKFPSIYRAFQSMCDRGWSYVVKAGTIILLCNAVVFVMQSFDWKLNLVAEGMEKTSILATIASPIAVLLVPIIGITAWQMAAATVTGFIAKENVVGTLAVCYGISNLIDAEAFEMTAGAGEGVVQAFGITPVAALAFLMFNLFSPPCFAAIGAMRAEMKSGKWLFGAIMFQLGVGYTVAYVVYTLGTILTGDKLNVAGAIGGLCAVLIMIATVVKLIVDADRKYASEKKSDDKKALAKV